MRHRLSIKPTQTNRPTNPNWLPHVDHAGRLARLAEPFPNTRQTILEIAEAWDFSDDTLGFLQLFPPDEEFLSRQDFLLHIKALEKLIREERRLCA